MPIFRSLVLIFLCSISGLLFPPEDATAAISDIRSGTTMSLFGVAFASSSIGIAVGSGGTILLTTDSGTSWKSQKSGTQEALYDVAFASKKIG